MTSEIAGRPRVQKLFVRLTVLWAIICATRAGVTLWLLHSLSMQTFVTAKTAYGPGSAVLGAALTVALAARVARREGLLPGASHLPAYG
jgi:NO-binding membrane sensor protein with MHYT domain